MRLIPDETPTAAELGFTKRRIRPAGEESNLSKAERLLTRFALEGEESFTLAELDELEMLLSRVTLAARRAKQRALMDKLYRLRKAA